MLFSSHRWRGHQLLQLRHIGVIAFGMSVQLLTSLIIQHRQSFTAHPAFHKAAFYANLAAGKDVDTKAYPEIKPLGYFALNSCAAYDHAQVVISVISATLTETMVGEPGSLPACARDIRANCFVQSKLREQHAMPGMEVGLVQFMERFMEREFTQKTSVDLEEMNEKLRREVVRSLAYCGSRPLADLADMSEGERAKWLFWNLHENLDEIRQMEPTLVGQVMSTQLTVSDGQSMWTEKKGLEKRVELGCKWNLLLTHPGIQNELTYELGEGWVHLFVADTPPAHPVLQENQKGYLDADHSLYPNQLFLDGWITEGVWREIKPQLYNGNPTCRTDILLLDNYLYPVKKGFDFVSGPAGSLGLTNIELRSFSHPAERRMTRRGEPRQRS